MGLPGSGKTTFAKEFSKRYGFIHLNSDRIRLGIFYNPKYDELEHKIVYDTLDNILSNLLKHGKNVVYDANLNKLTHRKEKYSIAKKNRSKVLTCYFKVPEEVALKRLLSRRHEIPKNKWKSSPEEVYHRLKEQIEPPKKNEPVVKFNHQVELDHQVVSVAERLETI